DRRRSCRDRRSKRPAAGQRHRRDRGRGRCRARRPSRPGRTISNQPEGARLLCRPGHESHPGQGQPGPRQRVVAEETRMSAIRTCRDDERATILAIVNAAAEAYRGVIPADCWHEPYMPASELDSEIAAGVQFWGYEADGALVGIMGIQTVRDVDLIRHAY